MALGHVGKEPDTTEELTESSIKSSEGGGGSVSEALPNLSAAVAKLLSNSKHINADGWAQLDKDLTKQLVLRACAIVAPVEGVARIGTEIASPNRPPTSHLGKPFRWPR